VAVIAAGIPLGGVLVAAGVAVFVGLYVVTSESMYRYLRNTHLS
jgi:hypothetical protein